MANITNTDINNFLQSFPKSEVVEILKEIDEKINSLHKISSKDFLFFNEILKNYYTKTKQLSESNAVLVAIYSKEIFSAAMHLRDKNKLQKDFVIGTDIDVNNLIEWLSTAFNSFSLTIVPFNNYKQNLITLKYLLANLKLHLSYITLNNKDDFKGHVVLLENKIESSILSVESVGEKITLLSKKLFDIKDLTLNAKDSTSSELCDQIVTLNKGLESLSVEDYWSNDMIMNINAHTQMCFASMGEIITNLQYHDIIRQKMEHIQESQQELIKGIVNIDEFAGDDDSLSQLANFIVNIPEVTSVQVAQLLYTNKDYQTSLEKISNKLLEVSREMKKLGGIYNLLNNNTDKFKDDFLSDVIIGRSGFVDFINEIRSRWSGIDSDVNALMVDYSCLKEDLQKMFGEEKAIRNEIRQLEHLIKENGKNFGVELVNKLSDIISDLQVNSNSLKNNLNSITQQMSNVLSLFDKLKINYDEIIISSESIDSLSALLDKACALSVEQASNSLKISEEINSSINKVEYYSYFKTTVEEIVGLLNEINAKVDYDSMKGVFGENNVILDHMKSYYTMHSERHVHESLSHEHESFVANEDSNDLMDENDVELF